MVMAALEGPDRPITIARAAQIAGLRAHTLRLAAREGRLYAAKLGPDWITNRRHLHRYLMGRKRGPRKSLPEAYEVPEGEEP
jgi:hypothetical protein